MQSQDLVKVVQMVKTVQSWDKNLSIVQHQDVVKVVQMVKTVPSWLFGEEVILFNLMCLNNPCL